MILILSIILLPLINASISIEPSQLNISINKDSEQSFKINITNYYDFDIYNLTFSNLSGFNFPEINIPKNTAKEITFVVKTNYSYDGIINSNVNFKYLANIPEEITTYNLSITNQGINNQTNNYITIRKGDSIKWINLDDVTHNLQSTEFEWTLNPNDTFIRSFDSIKVIEYRSLVAGITLFTGTIEVINRTGSYLVSNPLYSFNYPVKLRSIPEETTLEASLSQVNYTIDVSSYKEGLLTIKNIGTNNAENINLISSPDWITFDENDFKIIPNEIKYIKFKIYPKLMQTNETNSSYEISLLIKGINTKEYTNKLIVFVPYSNVFGDLSTEQGFVTWMNNVFCPAHPENYLCNTSARNISETARIIYRESEFSINMTGGEWYNLVKVVGQIKGVQDRSENEKVTFESQMTNDIKETKLQMNETANKVNKFISDQNNWTISLWVIGFFLFLASCITFIIFQIRKLNKKKELIDVYTYHKF